MHCTSFFRMCEECTSRRRVLSAQNSKETSAMHLAKIRNKQVCYSFYKMGPHKIKNLLENCRNFVFLFSPVRHLISATKITNALLRMRIPNFKTTNALSRMRNTRYKPTNALGACADGKSFRSACIFLQSNELFRSRVMLFIQSE